MKKLLYLAPLFLMLAACSHSTDMTTTNAGTNSVHWIVPSVGTDYAYESMSPGFARPGFDTVTILTTGQHLGGKTGVIGCLDRAGTAGTFFYNLETNGDISYGDSSTNALGLTTYDWKTFPTGSQKPISDRAIDTTAAQGIHTVQSDVRAFIGAETLTTLAGTFSTLHVRETSIQIISGPDSLDCDASDTAITDTWFAPSIGLYFKIVDSGTNDGVTDDSSEVDLIKVIPK